MVHAIMGRAMSFTPLPSWFKEGAAEFIHGADERLSGDTAGGTNVAGILAAFNADNVSASAGYSGGYAALKYMHQRIGGDGVKGLMQYLGNNGATLDQALANASNGAFAGLADFQTQFNDDAATFVAGLDLDNADVGAIGGEDSDGGLTLSAADVLPNQGAGSSVLRAFSEDLPSLYNALGTGGNNRIKLQIGAEANETMEIGISAFSVGAMALNNLDLTKNAGIAVLDIDDALAYIDTQRAYLGATQNRLEYSIENLMNVAENSAASRSRILDTDYAAETANLVSRQIIQQAAQSILVQANQRPQAILALLNF